MLLLDALKHKMPHKFKWTQIYGLCSLREVNLDAVICHCMYWRENGQHCSATCFGWFAPQVSHADSTQSVHYICKTFCWLRSALLFIAWPLRNQDCQEWEDNGLFPETSKGLWRSGWSCLEHAVLDKLVPVSRSCLPPNPALSSSWGCKQEASWQLIHNVSCTIAAHFFISVLFTTTFFFL